MTAGGRFCLGLAWKRSRSAESVRLSLLPAAVAIIAAGTMVPLELRDLALGLDAAALHLEQTVNYIGLFDRDAFENALLYVPLGVALGRVGLLRAGLVGFGLAAVAELAQLFAQGRTPELFDVAANTLGALVGFALIRGGNRLFGWPLGWLPLGRPAGFGALLCFIALSALVGTRFTPRTDFSNWDSRCVLSIGDEPSGGRPWNGEIMGLAVVPAAVSPELLADLYAAGPGASAWNRRTFSPAAVFQRGEVEDLESLRGQPLLSPDESRDFSAELQRRNEITILVWLRTGDVVQTGPARILTYAIDPFRRNFTLGQDAEVIEFRLRTPASGPNGRARMLRTDAVLRPGETTLIAASYDGRISRIDVNGETVARLDMGAEQSIVKLGRSEMQLVAVALAALLTASGLGVLGVGLPLAAWTAGLTAGGFAGAALGWTIGSEHGTGFLVRLAILGAVGGLATLLGTTPSAAIADR